MNSTPWSYRLFRWTWSGLDLLFPPVCGGCKKAGWRWCPDCQARVPRITSPYCDTCGIPTSTSGTCDKCKTNRPDYHVMRSWAIFDSPIQDALHTLKYRRNIGLGEALAAQLADYVRSLRWEIDLVIPIPLGKKRMQERGYNQVAIMAQPLAYELGWSYSPQALWKARETRSQVGLNISQRAANVDNAYQANPEMVKRKSILLMDDVATTGSTVSSSTRALLRAGAREVYVLTIARALSHHDLNRV